MNQTFPNNPATIYKGIAAKDLDPNSTQLLVICPELLPNSAIGTIDAGITKSTVKLQDRDGVAISANITTANHIVATWEGGSNAQRAPLIKKGETVNIQRVAGQDRYIWSTSGYGREFRTTDRKYIEVSALDTKDQSKPRDDSNTYSAYLDSEGKKVGMRTSKANGEACAFIMEGDLKQGTFYLTDDTPGPSNRIYMDSGTISGKPKLQLNLSTGITVILDNEDLVVEIPKQLKLKIGDRLIVDSPLTVLNPVSKGAILINASSISFVVAKDIILKAGNVIGLIAKSTKVGGILITAILRATAAARGVFGSNYSESKITRVETDKITEPSNSADTTPGTVSY